MYLVDTNVISAAAPTRATLPALADWIEDHSTLLFLSAITVAEIDDGIAKLRREGASRKAADLTGWLETILHLYSDRILPFDVPTARIAGAIADRARALGHAPGFADIIVAATAEYRGLTILSRNLRHFMPLCVSVLDPFTALPAD